jgi:hypothetical protein
MNAIKILKKEIFVVFRSAIDGKMNRPIKKILERCFVGVRQTVILR